MGIRLSDTALLLVLDDAVAVARGAEVLPELWTRRTERLGALGTKTYIAALGAAMLAKATDDRVDTLAQDVNAGPKAYSLRKVAERARNNQGRFHMGATGRNPVNNRPFLGGPGRIDEFTKIHPRSRPAYELFRDCLVDLNRMPASEARLALAAWLRVRMAVQRAELDAHRRSLDLATGLDVSTLVGVVERFVGEDSEGGRRGQAFVAAVLDSAFDEVVLQPVNHPKPGDVRVCRQGEVVWIVEVKQVAVEEATAFELASEARALGASLALLAVMADHHEPLDRDRARRRALADHRVLLQITESAGELISAVAVFSTTTVEEIVARLPGHYAARMREHGLSEQGQRRWAQLIEARTQ